jgi:peptide/nickel transport system substrate-binding protein
MIQLGLTVPLANAMLAHAGVALAQTKFEYKPTKRGGGGALKEIPDRLFTRADEVIE